MAFGTLGQVLTGGSRQSSGSQQRIFGPQADFLRNEFFPQLTTLAQNFNPQSLTPGFNPLQVAGQNLGANAALGLPIPQVNQAFTQALDPLSGINPLLAQSLQATFNPFLQSFQNTIRPLSQRFGEDVSNLGQDFQTLVGRNIQNFQNQILPGIRDEAIAAGQLSGSGFNRLQTDAQQQIANTLADATTGAGRNFQSLSRGLTDQFGNAQNNLIAQLSSLTGNAQQNAFNQGINQRLSALGLAPSIGQFNFLPSQLLQDIGGQQRDLQIQQAGAPISFLQQLASLSGNPTVLGSSGSSGVQQRGLTQGFADIGSAFPGGFSDRRLKRNIKQIGSLVNGLPVYLFEYIWGQWAIGCMADEVKAIFPQAVIKHPSGYDWVNYGEIYA